jgi:hypothetical protein
MGAVNRGVQRNQATASRRQRATVKLEMRAFGSLFQNVGIV